MIYLAIGRCEDRYSSQHDKAQKMLLSLLADLGHPNEEIKKNENGRPYVNIEQLDISISHSNEIAVCAVLTDDILESEDYITIPLSGDRIGIDIEELSTDDDLEKKKRISERFLKESISSKEEFLRLWTKKEAFGKMTGEGFFSKGDNANIITLSINIDDKIYYLSISVI